MTAPVIRIQNPFDVDCDVIIDVRSPSEFAEDHVVGAINKPSLSDDERAIVGTLYKQKSAFEARKIGASLIARNVAQHIETSFQDKPAEFTPLIYCWRGGQRSRAVAHIFSEIGWRCFVLDGGYKHYRKQVLDSLDILPAQLRLVIIAGHTGSAKTALLHHLSDKGAQILDLEGMAGHKGSVLGHQATPQPSQKYFESQIAHQLSHFDLAKPVFIESESSKIGQVHIPKILWQHMVSAPLIMVTTPQEKRADYLVQDYANLISDTRRLHDLIRGMRHRHGADITGEWQRLLDEQNWHGLARRLLADHYDPAYDKSVLRHNRTVALAIDQPDCTPDNLHQTAHIILNTDFDTPAC